MSLPVDDPRWRGFRKRSEVATVEDLLQLRISPLALEAVALTSAHGRRLGQDIVAERDVPSFDRSAMDGYAIRAEDSFGASEYSPIPLAIIGEARPGRPCIKTLNPGTAIHITTGAPIPEGANAVAPVEQTRIGPGDNTIEVVSAVSPLQHVGKCGEDIRAGTSLFTKGRKLRPQDIGLLASLGICTLPAFRKPTVTIISTGNELLAAGDSPRHNHIFDANTPMLRSLVERDGAILEASHLLADDRKQIKLAIQKSKSDAIVISGGSSVGDEDFMPELVQEIGELCIHGIAMRPSSPTGIGFIDHRPIFLLPGNPVSCLCAYDFFVGPSLRMLGGGEFSWPHPRVFLTLKRKLASVAGRVDYARVRIDENGVEPVMIAGASILSSVSQADGVVIIERDLEGIEAGQSVEVRLYE